MIDLGITRIFIGTRAVGVDLDEVNADRVGREVLAAPSRVITPAGRAD